MKHLKNGLMILTTSVFSLILFAQPPIADGNLMRFSNVASYETYADKISDRNYLTGIARGSTTLTTLEEQRGPGVDTLYPDFLITVLNTDYILRIGSYLIKIDVLSDRGLVIAASQPNSYSSLVNNNLFATGMMRLAGDEEYGMELLEGLENGSITPANYQTFLSTRRSCRRADRKTDKAIEQWDMIWANSCDNSFQDFYGMDNKVVYQKFIVYFSLQTKIKSVWRCYYGSWTLPPHYYAEIRLTGTAQYRKRCGAEVKKSEAQYTPFGILLDWRPYEGARSLSHYISGAFFEIRHTYDGVPNPHPWHRSRDYRIIDGY